MVATCAHLVQGRLSSRGDVYQGERVWYSTGEWNETAGYQATLKIEDQICKAISIAPS